jgi:hypothetical protein
MRLGFYSAHARRHIEAARGLVQERGFAADPAGIRAARAAILALGAEDPRRSVASELDFHSLSGCRDLLFHVQEQSFTLPQLGAMIEELGIEFLGFEFLDPAPRIAYARRFPDDGAATSLANWDAFEREAPATFHNMYQFWCRKS